MRVIRHTLFSLMLAIGPAGLCLAQEEEAGGKSYVMSYFIVGLGITLGLVAICKSAGRRKEVRKPD